MENLIEWIGYLASFIILVSLLMRSIKRLRIVNLIGAAIFTFYGYQIGSFPVMIMNLGIVFINIYYIKQIFASEDYFRVLSVDQDSDYVQALINFYRKDIENFMTVDDKPLADSKFRFLILRNMNPAGVFIARPYDGKTLEITLDYAIPQFQDFKTTKHVYDKEQQRFKEAGYTRFIAFSTSQTHHKYLRRMGFEPTDTETGTAFIKTI